MPEPVLAGDRILFCGLSHTKLEIQHIVHDHQVMHYMRTGIDRPSGYIWQWLKHRV
jgi:hypothetical protein